MLGTVFKFEQKLKLKAKMLLVLNLNNDEIKGNEK